MADDDTDIMTTDGDSANHMDTREKDPRGEMHDDKDTDEDEPLVETGQNDSVNPPQSYEAEPEKTDDAEGGSATPGAAAEGGEAEDGMATEESSEREAAASAKPTENAAKPKLNSKKQSPFKARRIRRSYRLRDRHSSSSSSGSGSGANNIDDGRRDSSSSDTGGTESDAQRDGDGPQHDSATASAEDDTRPVSRRDINSDLENELMAKPLPGATWHALPMLKSRELGTLRSQTTFRDQVIGCAHIVSRFQRYAELKYHEGCVNTLHFNQSGRMLASGSDDLKVALWDWARKRTTLIYPSGHRSNVFQAKFMPFSGDTTLVTCARDGQVRVGELSSTGVCKETKKLVQHKGAAHKLGLEPESPVVFLSCGEDAVVYNIDLRTPTTTKLVTVKQEEKKVALYSVNINPCNPNEYCLGGRDHYVRVYDRRSIPETEDNIVKKFCPHHLMNSEARANVTCCLYSYNGREILSSYNDEDIYLFDSNHSDGADYIHSYKGHRNNATVKGVNFYGPSSQFIVSGSDCGNVFLWEKQSEKIVQCMKGDTGGVVNCLEPHPSSAVLATSGLDHDVKIWMPTARDTCSLDGLKRTMYSNRREREEESHREPDSQLLMFLMDHLRRRARRQARQADRNPDGDSSTSDSDDSDDDDDDDDDADEDEEAAMRNDRIQCAPS